MKLKSQHAHVQVNSEKVIRCGRRWMVVVGEVTLPEREENIRASECRSMSTPESGIGRRRHEFAYV